MKRIALICFCVLLTSCAQIKMMLAQHDPVMADHYVKTYLAVQDASCEAKDTFKPAIQSARALATYAEFRDDTQKESATAVLVNLQKAENNDGVGCDRWLNLSKQRLQILQKAWSTR